MTARLSKSQVQGIYARLIQVLEKGLGKIVRAADVAREFDVKPQSVQQWKRGDSAPNRDRLYAFSGKWKANFDWLLTGKGEMGEVASAALEESEPKKDELLHSKLVVENEFAVMFFKAQQLFDESDLKELREVLKPIHKKIDDMLDKRGEQEE